MREIKFKFYLKEIGSDLVFSKTFDYAAIFSGTAKRYFNEQHPDSFIIAKCEFTGLKDKNGKDIYEDDKILFVNKKEGSIKFMEGCFQIVEIENNPINGYLLSSFNVSIEIIGSIHDTK